MVNKVCNMHEIKGFPQIIFQFNGPDREVLILKDSYKNWYCKIHIGIKPYYEMQLKNLHKIKCNIKSL